MPKSSSVARPRGMHVRSAAATRNPARTAPIAEAGRLGPPESGGQCLDLGVCREVRV